jgi:TolB protein
MYLPSGRLIFQSPRNYADANEVDLYTMDADGRTQRRLIAAPGFFDGVPVPAPNGQQIAFMRGTFDRTAQTFHWELFLSDSAGQNVRALTANAWSSQVPSWLPNGREVVIYANPDGRDQLFVLDVNTRAVRPLTSSPGNDTAPAVSRDGRFVAFNSDRAGTNDLYVLNVASGAVSRLTTGLAVRGQPSWSRNGERILFSAGGTGVEEVYVIRRDGSGLTRVTHGTEGIRP